MLHTAVSIRNALLSTLIYFFFIILDIQGFLGYLQHGRTIRNCDFNLFNLPESFLKENILIKSNYILFINFIIILHSATL